MSNRVRFCTGLLRVQSLAGVRYASSFFLVSILSGSPLYMPIVLSRCTLSSLELQCFILSSARRTPEPTVDFPESRRRRKQPRTDCYLLTTTTKRTPYSEREKTTDPHARELPPAHAMCSTLQSARQPASACGRLLAYSVTVRTLGPCALWDRVLYLQCYASPLPPPKGHPRPPLGHQRHADGKLQLPPRHGQQLPARRQHLHHNRLDL